MYAHNFTRLRNVRRRIYRRNRLYRGVVRIAVTTAIATVLVIGGAIAAWQVNAERQHGRIELTNDGPPLSVQVCDETGQWPIGEPLDLVKRATLKLPDGNYRLQVNGAGRMGRSYRFAVNRGENVEYPLSLDEGRLLGRYPDSLKLANTNERPRDEPMPFPILASALELTPGRFDIVEFNGRGIIRRDAVSGKTIWDTASPDNLFHPGAIQPDGWARFLLTAGVFTSSNRPAISMATAPGMSSSSWATPTP